MLVYRHRWATVRTVFDFSRAKGEIEIEDVNVDTVNTVFKVGSEATVKVRGLNINKAVTEKQIEKGGKLIIDGEEKHNG